MSSNLQDRIMNWLMDLQMDNIIYMSNNDEASAIGAEIWNVLREKMNKNED